MTNSINSSHPVPSKLYYKQNTKKDGWGLYAAQEIHPGTIITAEEPIAAAVDGPYLSHVCSGCYLNTGTSQSGFDHPDQHKSLQRCSRCQTVYYCSVGCQKKDWAIHKLECVAFQNCRKHLKQVPGTFVRLVSRVLYWRHLYPKRYEIEYIPLFEKVDQLTESDKNEIVNILVVTRDVVGQDMMIHDLREMYQLISRIQSNGMSVVDSELTSIGASIFATLSIANHSCFPNAAVMFEGSVGTLRAIRPIQKDEQIYISYIDTLMTTEARKSELKLRYHFDCTCSFCDPDSSVPEDVKAKSLLLIKESDDVTGKSDRIKDANKSLDSAALEQNIFKRLNKLSCGYAILKECLSPTHADVISARHAYLLCLLDMKRFQQAFSIGKDHVLVKRQILGDTHPVVSVAKYLLFRIGLILSDSSITNPAITLPELVQIGSDAVESLGVSHGQKDSMYLHARKNLDLLVMESKMKALYHGDPNSLSFEIR